MSGIGEQKIKMANRNGNSAKLAGIEHAIEI
jgi:hypothetical protein